MNEQNTIEYQTIIIKAVNMVHVKHGDASCSFMTIPNGLRQHALAAAIIHCAPVKGSIGKLPDPSIKYDVNEMI